MFENEARMEGVQDRFPYDDLHLHDTCDHAAVSFVMLKFNTVWKCVCKCFRGNVIILKTMSYAFFVEDEVSE